MGDTLDILRQIALQVRNASAPAENTAERVGRVLVGILENLSQTDIEDLKAMFLRKDQPDTANKLITFIEGLISKGLIIAEGGIKLPSGAALYSLYENGTLAFAIDENGFVIYEKGTANKWSVITSAGAEFQNLVIKFLAQITDLEVSNKATTLDLVVQALAKTYNLTVDNTADLMHGIIREYLTSESFVSGFLGSGFKIWKDANGDWNGEFDKLTVRKIFTIFELVVQKVVHQGGMVIRSASGGRLKKVTDGGTYWKCEHDSTDDFLTDDQVLCQTFTGTSIKRYWRKVTSAGAGYFNLSKTDCEAGSATPEVGDNVAVLGNRTNTDRQSAQIDCAVGVDAPYRDDYAGINSYSLAGKLINRTGNLSGITDPDFGVLSGSGLIGMNAYLKGVFRLKSSGKLVEDAISDAQSESNAYTDGKITTVETNFEIREGQISSKVIQATTAATQASGYATSASGSASTASTKASEAAGSATNAANSANQASNILTTVTSKETSINQTADAIELKAVRAESAAGRAENAEASINLKADGIVLQASSQAAQQAVNGVQIGGRNLLLNSKINSELYQETPTVPIRRFENNLTQDIIAGREYCFSYSVAAAVAGELIYLTLTDTVSWYFRYTVTVTPTDTDYHVYSGTIVSPVSLSAGSVMAFYQELGSKSCYVKWVKLEQGNKATDWTPAPEDVDADATTKANTAESNAKSYANSTFTTKTEFSSQLTILNNSISAKVSQTDFNSLNTRVSSAEQKITSDAIISTVSSTITTAKNEAINAAAADATTKSDAAKSSAVSTAATDATTKANTAESNAKTYSNNTFTPLTTYNTKIAQLESSISLKADSTTVNGINTRLSSAEAKITPDAINLTVRSQITTAVNSVQVGGRNLIVNSKSIIGTDSLTLDLISGSTYTFSMTARTDGAYLYVHIYPPGGDWGSDIFPPVDMNSISGNKLEKTFVATTNGQYKIRIVEISGNLTVIKYPKLELGTKATDWTPAPEDVDASIALRPTTEEIKSQFTMDSSGISMMGKKIALTGLITFSSLASDAQTKITSAQSTAESALANAGTANQSIGTLQSSLGQMAYQNMVSLAKLDSTIVEGGYLRTSLIDVNILIAKLLKTNSEGPRVEIAGSLIDVFGDFASPNIRFGVNASGYAVLTYYDNNGNKLYDLGPQGIDWGSIVQPSWSTTKLTPVSALQLGDVYPDWDDVATYHQGYVPVNNITTNTGSTYYKYYAGSNPTITQEQRDQEKYLHVSNSLSSATIANGWYSSSVNSPMQYIGNNTGQYIKPAADGIYPNANGVLDIEGTIKYRRLVEYKNGYATGRVVMVFWNDGEFV